MQYKVYFHVQTAPRHTVHYVTNTWQKMLCVGNKASEGYVMLVPQVVGIPEVLSIAKLMTE